MQEPCGKEILGNKTLNVPEPKAQETYRKHIRTPGWRPRQAICCILYGPLRSLEIRHSMYDQDPEPKKATVSREGDRRGECVVC